MFIISQDFLLLDATNLKIWVTTTVYYRVTHKGWDCKDDIKLFKFYDSKVKSSALNIVGKYFFIDFTQIEAS